MVIGVAVFGVSALAPSAAPDAGAPTQAAINPTPAERSVDAATSPLGSASVVVGARRSAGSVASDRRPGPSDGTMSPASSNCRMRNVTDSQGNPVARKECF